MSSVVWGLLIAVYPYITGLVAGSFIVSILPIFFKKGELRNISILSLIVSWAFLLVSPIPLVLELGSPSKSVNIFIFPQWSSAMAMFGYLWLCLLALTTIDIVILNWYRNAPWFNNVVRLLSLIGVLLAVLFSGYIGFIFGSMKAKELWYSPLIPVSFLLSAILSGSALVALLYIILWRLRGIKTNPEILNSIGKFVWWTLLLKMVFTSLEVLSRTYGYTVTWGEVFKILTGPLALSYLGVEILIGGIVPLIAFAFRSIRISEVGSILISLFILAGAFAYRWNVIIGGQLLVEVVPHLYSGTTFIPIVPGVELLWIAGVFLLWAFLFSLGLVIFPKWREVGTYE